MYFLTIQKTMETNSGMDVLLSEKLAFWKIANKKAWVQITPYFSIVGMFW